MECIPSLKCLVSLFIKLLCDIFSSLAFSIMQNQKINFYLSVHYMEFYNFAMVVEWGKWTVTSHGIKWDAPPFRLHSSKTYFVMVSSLDWNADTANNTQTFYLLSCCLDSHLKFFANKLCNGLSLANFILFGVIMMDMSILYIKHDKISKIDRCPRLRFWNPEPSY